MGPGLQDREQPTGSLGASAFSLFEEMVVFPFLPALP